jgi:molecular chaperone GrpE
MTEKETTFPSTPNPTGVSPTPDSGTPSVPASTTLPSPEAQLDALKGEMEALNAKYLTACADLDNQRKRHAREREEFLRYGMAGLIGELLPVVDNFELALESAAKLHPEAKATLDGFAMIPAQFMQILTAAGASPVKPAPGDAFDPNFHQSVGQEASKTIPEHAIASCQRPGYKLHDRILRPAFVTLSSGPTAK